VEAQERANAWARQRRQLDLPEHEYTGEQNHCRACYSEYMRRWRNGRMQLQLEPHEPVSEWHCRACRKRLSLNWQMKRRQTQFPLHDYTGSEYHCEACSREYNRRWRAARMARETEPHEYTGQQYHCRACQREYNRRRKAERMARVLEPHVPVSIWHCRTCCYRLSALNRRVKREMNEYEVDQKTERLLAKRARREARRDAERADGDAAAIPPEQGERLLLPGPAPEPLGVPEGDVVAEETGEAWMMPLVCVLCGRPWEQHANRCECGGFCTWGTEKGGKPSSWDIAENGNWTPKAPPKFL
jgi:hypothetical protein